MQAGLLCISYVVVTYPAILGDREFKNLAKCCTLNRLLVYEAYLSIRPVVFAIVV